METLAPGASFDQDLQEYIQAYSKQHDMEDTDYMDQSEDDAVMFLPTRQVAEEQLRDVKKTLYKNKILPLKIRAIICWSREWTSLRAAIVLVIVVTFILVSLGVVYWLNKYQNELRHGLTRGDCIETDCQLLNPLKCCCNITFIPLDVNKNATDIWTCTTDLDICVPSSTRNALPHNDRCWINPNFEIWKSLPPKMWILQTFIILSLAVLAALVFVLSLCCTLPVPNKLLSDYYAAQAMMQQNHDLYAYVPFGDK